MWSWVLHRITGVAIFFFLLVHILDTSLVRLSPEGYNVVIASYMCLPPAQSGSEELHAARRDPADVPAPDHPLDAA